MIAQTFTAENRDTLVIEIAQFIRDCGFYVVHETKLHAERMSFREVAVKYNLKASTLSNRLKRFKFHFPHERGKTRILWLNITPELHDHLRQ